MAEIEEHYILRVPDTALADRLRSTLREEPAAQPVDKELQLTFESAHCFRNGSGLFLHSARLHWAAGSNSRTMQCQAIHMHA